MQITDLNDNKKPFRMINTRFTDKKSILSIIEKNEIIMATISQEIIEVEGVNGEMQPIPSNSIKIVIDLIEKKGD